MGWPRGRWTETLPRYQAHFASLPDMLDRYGASAADERAREAHARLAPGENV
jgi:hypothetical protein